MRPVPMGVLWEADFAIRWVPQVRVPNLGIFSQQQKIPPAIPRSTGNDESAAPRTSQLLLCHSEEQPRRGIRFSLHLAANPQTATTTSRPRLCHSEERQQRGICFPLLFSSPASLAPTLRQPSFSRESGTPRFSSLLLVLSRAW